jgi:hypothetical protein
MAIAMTVSALIDGFVSSYSPRLPLWLAFAFYMVSMGLSLQAQRGQDSSS